MQIMTGIPSAETGPNCIACPVVGVALGELAAQLTPPEQWLYNPPEARAAEGVYTPDAVRMAVAKYRLGVSIDSPTYGAPAARPPLDGVVWHMQRRVDKGNYLAPADIDTLQQVVVHRQAVRARWAALLEPTRVRLAQDAESHLDEAAAVLSKRDPGQAVQRELDRMRKPRDTDIYQEAIDGLYNKLDAFDTLYVPDQAPFQVARVALERCGGPWLLARKRLFKGLSIEYVCPNGERDKAYLKAKEAHENAPREQGR